MDLDWLWSFSTDYEVRLLDRVDRAYSTNVFEYRGEPPGRGIGVWKVDAQQELHSGPILAVAPGSAPAWIGLFAGGGYGVPPARRPAVIPFPDGATLCVVNSGLGCLVDVERPETASAVECSPVIDVRVAADHGIVLFHDYTDLVAYSRSGLLWKSGRLAWDDLRLVRVEGTTIHATGFNAPENNRDYPFTVDLLTGHSSDKPYTW